MDMVSSFIGYIVTIMILLNDLFSKEIKFAPKQHIFRVECFYLQVQFPKWASFAVRGAAGPDIRQIL